MCIAFGAKEFEGEKGEEIAQGRDGLGSRQASLLNHRSQIEPLNEGREEENPGSLAIKWFFSDIGNGDLLGHRRHLGPFDGEAKFEPGSSRQLRVPSSARILSMVRTETSTPSSERSWVISPAERRCSLQVQILALSAASIRWRLFLSSGTGSEKSIFSWVKRYLSR